MAAWKEAPGWAWAYSARPSYGIIVAVRAPMLADGKYYLAHIETPNTVLYAPHPFNGLDDAKAWVEHELHIGRPRSTVEPMNSVSDQPGLLRMSEVAELLNISRAKAYELVGAGVIPSIMIGKLRRVSRRALEAWIREHEART